MNKYQTGQLSQTFPTVIAMGLLAGMSTSALMNGSEIYPGINSPFNKPGYNATYSNGVSTTANPRLGFSNQMYESSYTSTADSNFEISVSGFYANLAASQERLGAVFEAVLFDNLWDLYD